MQIPVNIGTIENWPKLGNRESPQLRETGPPRPSMPIPTDWVPPALPRVASEGAKQIAADHGNQKPVRVIRINQRIRAVKILAGLPVNDDEKQGDQEYFFSPVGFAALIVLRLSRLCPRHTILLPALIIGGRRFHLIQGRRQAFQSLSCRRVPPVRTSVGPTPSTPRHVRLSGPEIRFRQRDVEFRARLFMPARQWLQALERPVVVLQGKKNHALRS